MLIENKVTHLHQQICKINKTFLFHLMNESQVKNITSHSYKSVFVEQKIVLNVSGLKGSVTDS